MTLTTKQLLTLIAAVAGSGGAVEMRVAVARLETSVSAVDQRVARIEREIDNSHRLATK